MKEKKFWKPGSDKPTNEGVNKPTRKIDEDTSRNHNNSTTSINVGAKPVLSKSVLSMKFMSRKVEAEELQREETKKRKIVSDSQWAHQHQPSNQTNTSELQCVEINENDVYSELPGRRSFGGFNPSVERIYGSHLNSVPSEKKANREHIIVAKFDKLVSLPRGPNQGVMQPMKGEGKKSQKKKSSKR